MTKQDKKFLRAVGQSVYLNRVRMGVSQEALAAAVGLKRTSITNLEAGRQNTSILRLRAISSALDSDLMDLLRGCDE